MAGRRVLIFWFLLVFFRAPISGAIAAELPVPFPALEAETLLGRSVQLPGEFHHSVIWIVVGFTKDSQKATSICSEKLEQRFSGRGYSAAILQGAPFFIKGLIKNGIRASVPDARRDRYLILNEGRTALEKIAGVDEESNDDAFVLGLRAQSPSGYEVVFVSHGDCGAAHFPSIEKKIVTLLDQKR